MTTPIHEISLQAYTNRVCEILDAQTEPVIPVGHSVGGVVIRQAAGYRPQKIEKLVYLTAFLLQNGEFSHQYGEADKDALLLSNLIIAEDQSYTTVREDALKEVFYGDYSDEDVMKAKSLLVPYAAAPLATPVNTSPNNFGRVPRIYISWYRDRAIRPPPQKKMYTYLPCEKVIGMDTSHSPFFSASEELISHLLSL